MISSEITFFTKEEDGFVKNWYSSLDSDLIIWEKNKEIYSLRFVMKKNENKEIVLDFNITNPKLKFYITENQDVSPLKNNTQLLIQDKSISDKYFITKLKEVFGGKLKSEHQIVFEKLNYFVE